MVCVGLINIGYVYNTYPRIFQIPICRTDCFQRSVLNRIVQIWNSLPQSIRCISVYNTFVSELKHCFLEKIDSQFKSEQRFHFKCLCNNCRL